MVQNQPSHLYTPVWFRTNPAGSFTPVRFRTSPQVHTYLHALKDDAGLLPLCGERALPVAKVMRKEAWHTQRQDQASGVSLEILEHVPPKPESAYFLLCAFTYTSDFTGRCPPLPLSEKRVSLQLQLIIPGCDSVSTYKLLWKSSSLPEEVFLATCDCSEPPNCERHEMF